MSQWLCRSGTFVDRDSGRESIDMCIGGISNKSVGNESGLILVASVLL